MWSLALACGNSQECVLANLISWPLLGGTMFFTGIGMVVAGGSGPPADSNRVELIGLAPWRGPRRAGELAVTGATGALRVTF